MKNRLDMAEMMVEVGPSLSHSSNTSRSPRGPGWVMPETHDEMLGLEQPHPVGATGHKESTRWEGRQH